MTSPAVAAGLTTAQELGALAADDISANANLTAAAAALATAQSQLATAQAAENADAVTIASLQSAVTAAQNALAALQAAGAITQNQRNAVESALLADEPAGSTITWLSVAPWFQVNAPVSAPPPPVTPPPTTVPPSGMPASLAATIAIVDPGGLSVQVPGLPLLTTPSASTWTDQEGETGFVMYSPPAPGTDPTKDTWSSATHLVRCPDGSGYRTLFGTWLPGGNSPVQYGLAGIKNPGKGNAVYAKRLRFSSNFDFSLASGVKLGEPRTLSGKENHVINCGAYGQATNDGMNGWIGFLLQFPGGVGICVPGNPNEGWADEISYFLSKMANVLGAGRGEWHDVAWGITAEPVAGQPGGRLKIAVDKTLVFDSGRTGQGGVPAAGVHFFQAGTTMGWAGWKWDQTWGGDVSTDHPQADMSLDMDCPYVATG